jgi:hypothetical protein
MTVAAGDDDLRIVELAPGVFVAVRVPRRPAIATNPTTPSPRGREPRTG